MANACACGCGELLPETSTRQYKRGHKNRKPDDVTWPEAGLETTGDDPVTGEIEPEFTLEDAERDTPNDPEPKTREYKPKLNIKITAAVRRDVEGKLAFGFGMLAQTWSMIDPLCGSVAMEAGPDMAKKYTPIICQSPEVVRWLTKSGNFLIYIDALMATWPVIQVVFAHHVAKTVAVMPPGEQEPVAEYVVR